MLIPVLLTLPILIAFIFIYKKYETDNEKFLLLKLIGYYLLGGFMFSFNTIALPAGFFVYLVFFRPHINKPVKKAIASLGLLVFICGALNPFITKSYFQRQRVVNASSSNIFTIDFSRDHNLIKKKLGISEYAKIANFHVSFENSGSIETLRYLFLTEDSKGIVLYEVNFSSNKNKYIIRSTRVSEWPQYDRLINEAQFFYAMKYLDLNQVKLKFEYPCYAIRSGGNYSRWGAKSFNNFLITDNGLNKVKKEELPVEGYMFWIYGCETNYDCADRKVCILPIPK